MAKYSRIIRKFKKARILIVGDIMLDEYIWGQVERISPEAPIQVVEVRKVTHVPGGAANVANNISALWGQVHMIGVTGEDQEKTILTNGMMERGINPILFTEERPTIRKVRVMGQGQQLLRIDYELRSHISGKTTRRIIERVASLIGDIDCIVISDYAKGIVTRDLVKDLISVAEPCNVPIIVDPKPRNMKYFRGVNLVTPNHKEASIYASIEEENEEDLVKIGRKMVRQLGSNCLITRGEKGMSLFEEDGGILHVPTTARNVYDVTGAGDTVIAVVALSVASGADYPDAAAIANYAAGVVVGKLGTATVSQEELQEVLERHGAF